MSADGSAVVSGVDLALVTWVDGPVVDLSSQPRPHQHQRIGRCLCAKEPDGVETAHQQQQPDTDHLQLKSTLKKARASSSSETSAAIATKTVDASQHIVPQVVQVVTSQRTKQQPANEPGMTLDSKTTSTETTVRGRPINRANTTSIPAVVLPVKPILSRKNWLNNTIDSSPQQHQPSCLRRYGSQQSCKSATTVRSYVSNTSRGNHQVKSSV